MYDDTFESPYGTKNIRRKVLDLILEFCLAIGAAEIEKSTVQLFYEVIKICVLDAAGCSHLLHLISICCLLGLRELSL